MVSRPTPASGVPRVWLVLGDKLGDNAQVEVIAEALGWPFEIKRLAFKPRYQLGKPRFRPTLAHLDLGRSARLEPPWPDLVMTIGRRPTMAALWAHERAGKRFRLLLVGRPKRRIDRFDLVVVPSQYRLPPRPNVLNLDFPLMRVDERAIGAAAEAWRGRLSALPRPLTALLVGGPTGPFRLDPATAADLARRAREAAAGGGGSLYVSTSRRTPPAVTDALAACLPAGTPLYRFDAAAPDGGENPYRALLGLADRFIVTGDSVSMMVEVARLGRPLAIAPLPHGRDPLKRLKGALARALRHGDTAAAGGGGGLGVLADALARTGVVGYARDLTAMQRLLVVHGLAVWLGEPFRPPGPRAPDELAAVVARVRALMAPSAAP